MTTPNQAASAPPAAPGAPNSAGVGSGAAGPLNGSQGARTLEEVLGAHLFTLYPGQIVCDCEWTTEDDHSRAADARMIAAHVAHQATVVRGWLAEQLAGEGLREAVAEAIEEAVPRGIDESEAASAALAAVREHLTGEGSDG